MRKKAKTIKKRNLLHVLLAGVIGIFSLYFLLTVFLWMFINWQVYHPKKLLLDKYIANHYQELDQQVFSDIFTQAQACQELPDGSKQEACQKAVATALSEAIIEEELITANTDYWPYDLWFVKQTGRSYYRLGWSGKLEHITQRVDKDLVVGKKPVLFNYLMSQCDFFGTDARYDFACETYSSLKLSSQGTGYLVRLTPPHEETEFSIQLFFWPFRLISAFL